MSVLRLPSYSIIYIYIYVNVYVYIYIYIFMCVSFLSGGTVSTLLLLVAMSVQFKYRLVETATLCNTLQHTATHCNAMQHTTTHCNTPPSAEQIPSGSHSQKSARYNIYYVKCLHIIFFEKLPCRHLQKSTRYQTYNVQCI